MKITTCKNCSAEYEGKFCPACGQKAKVGRITVKQVWKEAQTSVFHLDTGFLYTIKEMVTRPGHAIREYLEGRRVNHVKPLKFALWGIAISYLIMHFLGVDEQILQTAAAANPEAKGSGRFGQFFMSNPTLMLLLMMPCYAAATKLFFKKAGYNYAEHFVLNCFLFGQLSFFSIFTIPIQRFLGNFNSLGLMLMSAFLLWFVYVGWGYLQFFQPKNRILGFLKSMLAIAFGYVFMIFIISIAVFIGILINPAWFKNFMQG